MKWPDRDDPELPERLRRSVRALAWVLLAALGAFALLVRRGLVEGWPPLSVFGVTTLGFVLLVLLQALRMAKAWEREIRAEREARRERQGPDADRPEPDPSSEARST